MKSVLLLFGLSVGAASGGPVVARYLSCINGQRARQARQINAPTVRAEAKRGERAGECAAHPQQDYRSRDHVISDRGREHTVQGEDDEGEQHEDRAQLEHAGERVRLVGVHELRQESEEENRQFGLRILIRMPETMT